jgi:hypothetical protein
MELAMHQVTINIPDEAYITAKERAKQEGFGSTEVFLSDLVISSISPDSDNQDHVFTTTVISELDRISAEIKAGAKTYTAEEVRTHLAQKRKAWLANHAS